MTKKLLKGTAHKYLFNDTEKEHWNENLKTFIALK